MVHNIVSMKSKHSQPPQNPREVTNLYLMQSWGHHSIHQHDKTHNNSINQTVSLVILKEKVIHLAKDMSFLEDFRHLVIKSGKLYFPSTTEKLFAKLPPSLSKKIEESFKAKYPGLNSGVLPAIKFTHTFVSEMCKDAALAKELRDLSLCSAIPIPGYYKNNRKKYGMRKSRTYKGKPHNSHVKPFKRKYKDDRGRDIISAEFDDSSVYSITEGEGDTHQSISVIIQDAPFEEATFMLEEEINEDLSRLNCPKCQLTTCALCARNYIGKTVNVKGKQPHKPEEQKDFSSNEKKEELWQSKRSLLVRDLIDTLKIIDQLKAEQIRLEEQKDKEIRKLRAKLQKKKEEETEV
ncbi:hypothetical protein Tco_1086150 [Tanacetum coccineum]